MKKDNYRKILSEKFRAANQLETGPLTEEDEEYLRILAEARANHAKIKAARQEARKRLAARFAAVFIVAALVSSSYLLGMKSDTKASADPDDEVKVVQQGDNIIIGQGVSENDENVGVVTKTYYRLEDVPEEVLESEAYIESNRLKFIKAKLKQGRNIFFVTVCYTDEDGQQVEIEEEKTLRTENATTIISEEGELIIIADKIVHLQKIDKGCKATLYENGTELSIFLPYASKIKIEDMLDDLLN